MKKKCAVVISLLSLACLTGCVTPNMIDARSVEPLWRKVLVRHDSLVAQSNLSQVEQDVALRSSAALSDLLDEALKETP
jgi:hypothetical protein